MEESIVMQKIRQWLASKDAPIDSTNKQLEELEKAENPQPQQQEPDPQNMADGGEVQAADSDWNKVKEWISGGKQTQPIVATPAFRPQVSSPVSPAAKVPMAPPPPDYKAQATQALGNPADRSALVQKLNQPSLGETLGSLGTGIADAITMAAGKNTSYQKDLEGSLAAKKGTELDAFDKEREANKEIGAMASQMEAKDPNSELSKQAQSTYGALLAKVGIPPETIALMPASMIADLTGKSVDAMKAESEAKMAAASLGLGYDKLRAEEAAAKAKSEAEAAQLAQKDRTDAQSELNKNPIKNTVLGFMGNDNVEALRQRAGYDKAEGNAGPYGSEVVRNGKLYIWDPIVNKYRPGK